MNGTEALALLIAGIVAPWIVNLERRFLEPQSTAAKVWIAYVTCLVIAFGVSAATGTLLDMDWGNPPAALAQLGARAGAVVALANLVYNTNRGKFGLPPKEE